MINIQSRQKRKTIREQLRQMWQLRQMAKDERRRNEALKLYRSGMAQSKIAAKMGISSRTIQRWIRAQTTVPVRIEGMTADKDFTPPTSKMSQKCRDNSDNFDIGLSRRMAIRLLNLSEAALGAVEGTLTDPDARRADKLRAAALIGDWLGLGSSARHPSGLFVSIPDRLQEVFAIDLVPPPSVTPVTALPPTEKDED